MGRIRNERNTNVLLAIYIYIFVQYDYHSYVCNFTASLMTGLQGMILRLKLGLPS